MNFNLAFLLFSPLFLILILVFGAWMLVNYIRYSNSTYGIPSGNPFIKTMINRGIYGEFLLYRELQSIKGQKYILPNVYLTKDNGKTTEIDLIMVHPTGIYVFESKNYSGWIFGDESHQYWTQTFRSGKKVSFYNPIKQNKVHLDTVKKILKDIPDHLFFSYIIFSNSSELKKIKVISNNTYVLQRKNLLSLFNFNHLQNRLSILSEEQMESVYNLLNVYTLQSDEVKGKHVTNVKSIINK